jgi:hypothetical protein
MKLELRFGVWSLVIIVGKYAEHPLRALIGMGEGAYDDFDLAKEREAMWPENDENLKQIHRLKDEY